MARPVPKVGDVVEVERGGLWTSQAVTDPRSIIGYSPADLPMDATWWRWPRWHLSTVLLAMASDVTLPRGQRSECAGAASAVLEAPCPSFDAACRAYPFSTAAAAGLTWLAHPPDPHEVYDALVAYAEAHGIERDAP